MSAIEFPVNPSEASFHIVGNRKFQFSGGRWKITSNTPVINVIEQNPVVTISANNIDLSQGDFFKKTVSGDLTLTISNTLPVGKVTSFVLKLINGGSGNVTWWSANIRWPGGSYPTLTAVGVDTLGFISDDGGTSWDVYVMSLDSKLIA